MPLCLFNFFSQCPCVFTGGIINTPFWVYIIIIVVEEWTPQAPTIFGGIYGERGLVRFGFSQKLLSHHSGVFTGVVFAHRRDERILPLAKPQTYVFFIF